MRGRAAARAGWWRAPIGGFLRLSPVTQFALAGLLATVLIGIGAVAEIRQTATEQAVDDAKQTTRLAGRGIVEPTLEPGVLRGDPAALAKLDRLVRTRIRRDGIVRVKLWTPDGRVIYSDARRLIGSRFAVGDDERRVLREGGIDAEVSHLSAAENRYERQDGKLLEVYLPITGPGGRQLMFEAYHRFGSVANSGQRLWLMFAPALIGGLLLLQLVQLPLARSLARRLRRDQEEREALLHRALTASHTERRRIAADLHDGVVQDLVGVGYSLSAEAQKLNGDHPGATEALAHGAAQTRHSVRALRTLLVDIYPPALSQAGLVAALEDLARTTSVRGLPTVVDAPLTVELDNDVEQLLFRCAQEGLRNAVKHAGASNARIQLRAEDDVVSLTVVDDGAGFDTALVDDAAHGGHFGLRCLTDLVDDTGGSVEIRSAPGAGTTVDVQVPLAVAR